MLFSEISVVLWQGKCIGGSLNRSSFFQNTHGKTRFCPTSSVGSRFRIFFVPFKGDYQGKFYNSATPSAAFFPYSKSCLDFEEFISSTILDRVKNGSLLVWGKVGSVQPLHLVLHITVNTTKPRMCHDERFLKWWIKDLPLSYISHLTSLAFLAVCLNLISKQLSTIKVAMTTSSCRLTFSSSWV